MNTVDLVLPSKKKKWNFNKMRHGRQINKKHVDEDKAKQQQLEERKDDKKTKQL